MKVKLLLILFLFFLIVLCCSSKDKYKLIIESKNKWHGLMSESPQTLQNHDNITLSDISYPNTTYIKGEGNISYDLSNYNYIWSIVINTNNKSENLNLKVIKKTESFFIFIPIGDDSKEIVSDEINSKKKYAEVSCSLN